MPKGKQWSEEQTLTLINYYHKHSHLWDPRDSQYLNCILRNKTLKELQVLLKGFSVKSLDQKFCILRNKYLKEKAKLEHNGIKNEEEQIEKTDFQHYPHLNFLAPVINLDFKELVDSDSDNEQASISSENTELKEVSFCNIANVTSLAQSVDGSPLTNVSEATNGSSRVLKGKNLTINSNKKRKNESSETPVANRTMDGGAEFHFSKFVQTQLSAIKDSRSRNLAMLEIMQVLTNHLDPDITFVTQYTQ